MHKQFRFWIKPSIFLLLLILSGWVVYAYNLTDFITESVLREYVGRYGAFAPIIFILIYIISTILFFIPAIPFSLAGGALFGPFLGGCLVIIGGTIGSAITFFLARLLGEETVTRILSTRFKKIFLYEEKIASRGFQTVLILRLIPIISFNLLNVGFGLTRVSFRNFFWGTLLGIIPGTFATTILGDALVTSTIGYLPAFILFFVFVGGGVFYYYHTFKKQHGVKSF